MEEKKLQDAGSVETAEKRDSAVKADETVTEGAKREASKQSETKVAGAAANSNKGTSDSKSNNNTNQKKDSGSLGIKPYKQKEQSAFGKFIKKHKVLLVLFIVAVVVGALIFALMQWKKNFQDAMSNNKPTYEMTTVEKRDLNQTISTTGVIKSTEVRTLTSPVKDAKITAVNYEVGDYVNEGDVVVAFSVTNINQKIEDLQKDISTSKQKDAINSQNRSREYAFSYGSEAVNMTQATEKVNLTLQEVYEACDGYGSAKRAKEEYQDKYLRGELSEAEAAQYETKMAQLDQAVTNAYMRQQEAERAYQQAVEAQANTLRNSTNSLASADANYQLGNISANDSTTNLERQLKQYEDSLDDYLVYAPISGIVTEVNVEEGNGYISGSLMTIQKDDSFLVTTEIDEYDIPSVKEGQKVVIKTEATRDDELEGVVSFVSPTATATTGANASGGVTYKVEIDVKSHDPRIKIGMSAKLNIITESHSGVMAVRYDAIGEDEDGNPVVYYKDPELTKKVEAEKTKKKGNNKVTSSIPVFGTDGKPTNTPSEDESKEKKEKIPSRDGETVEDTSSNKPKGDDVVEIPVVIGVEDDFYTEITGDKIKEGMELIVPEKKNATNPFEEMMMSMGM